MAQVEVPSSGRHSIQVVQGKTNRASRKWNPAEPLKTEFFEIGFDGQCGSICRLLDLASGRAWATDKHQLAQLGYEIYSADDYEAHWKKYNRKHKTNWHWAVPDFLKPGVESAVTQRRWWMPELRGSHIERESTTLGTTVTMDLNFPIDAVQQFSCPEKFQVSFRFPEIEKAIHIKVRWTNKQACRVPSRTSITFAARATSPMTPTWPCESESFGS